MTATASRGPDVETASDGYASRFAGSAGRYLLDVQARSVRQVLQRTGRLTVLDVGGGHAQTAALMVADGHEVTVLGSAPEAHERLLGGEQADSIRLVTGDLLRLPFPDASFDLVLAVRLLTHMPQWEQLLAEMCRVARRYVVIDYPRPRGVNALTPLLFRLKRRIEGNTRTYRNFSDRQIAAAFRKNGFALEERVGQFVLPMVVHRISGSGVVPRGLERIARELGLSYALGSPVIVRADRKGA